MLEKQPLVASLWETAKASSSTITALWKYQDKSSFNLTHQKNTERTEKEWEKWSSSQYPSICRCSKYRGVWQKTLILHVYEPIMMCIHTGPLKMETCPQRQSDSLKITQQILGKVRFITQKQDLALVSSNKFLKSKHFLVHTMPLF